MLLLQEKKLLLQQVFQEKVFEKLVSILPTSTPVAATREETYSNTKTGETGKTGKTGENGENSKNGDKDENLRINLI